MFERYRRATSKSHQLWKRAVQIHPGGVNHNLRTFGLHRIGLYPPFMKRGEGPHLWDVDDNEYIDWWMTHFSILLGHNNPKVREAIQSRINMGLHLGTLNQNQVEFAEKLKKAIPYLDKVRFSVTGSEAVMYSVRLSRKFTNKRLVAKARGGWHGGNDALLYHIKYPFSEKPIPNGVSFEFNDQKSIDSLMKKNGKDLAAIVIEPVIGAGGALSPEPEFLPYLREETEARGILLIFDEIITGFRLCFGSAGKEVFGVEPDLITLGKIVAGGMPLGVYGGREDIMALAEPGKEGGCWVGGGTFSSHPVSMVSGIATLDTLHSLKGKYHTLNQRGNRFRDQLNDTFAAENMPTLATGVGSIVFLHWLKEKLGDSPITPSKIGEALDSTRQDLLQAALFEQGIFGYHGLGAISFVHTDKDIQMTQEALFRAIEEVKKYKM